ncbi:GNAT family N-acetyltransferase [Xanthomonas hyacinthi]|uniref:N-acetyltransferase n=1 Tax=Xanthomonas hyacinthi TaxID=56455 RepID=A0A2S7EXM2_9XANT|nr:GNAT family N-acetyltransferase [Xanthomonas hyacinthi]KLD79264.1 acetyltransferase [Xanthomonas hyacinthi DSM 19077]PPU97904.1 N-acetyltransferase [Xanthomonas hyacinthi]QGY76560.1 GNAT family N-acetyltransferase [Xanthomonas hyacinthi]
MSERILHTSVLDPRARALFDALEQEYGSRYQDVIARIGGSARDELQRYPPEAFMPPHGAFLLLLRDGETIGGGGFMRHRDPDTAEVKRVWTRRDLRRQGLARRVLVELEAQALRQGYTRIYLTTGFRQPEAVALYLRHGYTALFDLQADPESVVHLPFEKRLPNPVHSRAAASIQASVP